MELNSQTFEWTKEMQHNACEKKIIKFVPFSAEPKATDEAKFFKGSLESLLLRKLSLSSSFVFLVYLPDLTGSSPEC